MNALNANAKSAKAASAQAGGALVKSEPAKVGDVVSCLRCSWRGYVLTGDRIHEVCKLCKGTRTVTIEVYR